MKTILITGGTGFVGTHLVEKLVELGEKNIHVTAYKDGGEFISQYIPEENIHKLNLVDYEATLDLIRKIKPDEIYHLASLSNVGNSFEKRKFILETHMNLQLSLLTAVKEAAPETKILTIGTALEYKTSDQALDESAPLGPNNPYALSKLFQDMMAYSFAQSEDLNIVRVRPFNHIGERQAPGFAISDFAMQIVRIEQGAQDKIMVGNLEAVRDLTDVKDIVEGYILLMEKGEKNEVYNLGSGKGYSIKEILDKLCALSEKEIAVEIDPEKIRPVDLPYLVCNNDKVKKLGWEIKHPIDETLERVLNWWRKNI